MISRLISKVDALHYEGSGLKYILVHHIFSWSEMTKKTKTSCFEFLLCGQEGSQLYLPKFTGLSIDK